MRKAVLGLLVIAVLSIHSGIVKVDAADTQICYTSSGSNSTYIPAEPKPGGGATTGRGPKTGDMAGLMPWVIAAAGTMGLLVVIWKKRREEEEETEEVTRL